MTAVKTDAVLSKTEIDSWILEALNDGFTSFDRLLHSLPSVYPSLVIKTLEKLNAECKIPTEIIEQVQAVTKQQPRFIPEMFQGEGLPVPHPLDYEWRFTDSAVQRLLRAAMGLSKSGDTVALLGTPSLFEKAYLTGISDRRLVLIDKNTAALNYLSGSAEQASLIECDLLTDPVPRVAAQVVIVDAPWYPECIQAFLRAASQICTVSGHILISVPPLGVRPGITREWEQLVNNATSLNLQIVEFHPLSLPYLSPPFERNALKAEGITNYLYDWRRGDLAIFFRSIISDVPDHSHLSSEVEWIEQIINGVRIRIREQESRDFINPTLISLIPGDILPTVSRRDARRMLADVWTSGNRIYQCHGRHIAGMILRAIANKRDLCHEVAKALGRALTPEEISLVIQTGEQITHLVETEQSELFYHVN